MDRSASVCVLGLGYVGLPTMVACANAGFQVTGLDVVQDRVSRINAGHSYIEDVPEKTLASLVEQTKITATTDYGALENMDVVVICVPTPVNQHKEPDLGALQEAMTSLSRHMTGEKLVILQSTSYPGTTEEMVLPQLERADYRVGEDFYLAFSPERIDPSNKEFDVANIPKVVGGVTPRCGELATTFFSAVVKKAIPVSSPKVAEMTKLLENIFRSVNIALVNEMSELCRRMDIDIWEVVNAAATKPFGFMPFYPGIGVGGHCIPVDPFYLSWKARQYDFYVNFIELAARINDNMPYSAASRIVDIVAEKGTFIKGSRLLMLGVSFKRDIGDTRNSPSLRVAELLIGKGAAVDYSDPHVPEVTLGGRVVRSVDPDEANLKKYDATVILVDHGEYDLPLILRHSKLVIDAKDATRRLGPNPKVVKL